MRNFKQVILWLLFLATFENCKTSLLNNFRTSFRIIKNHLQTVSVETIEDLEYPRYNTDNMKKIANMWAEYYSCLKMMADRVIKPEIKRLVEGQNTQLKCRICPKPFQNYDELQWKYKPLLDPEYRQLEYLDLAHGMALTETKTLQIFNAVEGFQGVYACYQNKNVISVYVLEVSKDEMNVEIEKVENQTSDKVSVQINNRCFEIYYFWTPWSKCSNCGMMGRMFKYGTCYITAKKEEHNNTDCSAEAHKNSTRTLRKVELFHKINLQFFKDIILLKDLAPAGNTLQNWGIAAIENFHKGIPCASRFIPSAASQHVQKYKPVKVQIKYCLEYCDEYQIFQVYDPDGTVIETANNYEGVYSAYQKLPPLPPDVERRSVTVEFGADTIIQCPGTSLKNIPVTWKLKHQIILPEVIANQSNGRFVVDYVNRIHIKKSRLKDSQIYSCWQRQILVGTVNLHVEKKFKIGLDHHVALLALIIILGTFLLIGTNMISRKLEKRKE